MRYPARRSSRARRGGAAAQAGLVAALAVFGLFAGSCEDSGDAADGGPEDAEYTPTGPPTLILGHYVSLDPYTSDLSPLVDGGKLPLLEPIFQPSGGHWLMPTLRTTGIGLDITVQCTATTDDGESLATVDARARLFAIHEGSAELPNHPIAVTRGGDHYAPVDDLFGEGATLACAIEDDEGRRAERSVHAVLTAKLGE